MPNYSGKWTPSQILQARGQDLWPINGPFFYVDDVFSTYLYEGTGATLSINNGLDLDGEGGLVWIKERTDTGQHHFYDTERGATKRIHSNSTAAEATQSDALTAFNSNGFTLGTNSQVNDSGIDTCSWSFRKQAGFFDVVTYTGDGTSSRDIAHNLGSKPGFILTKRLNLSGNWTGYHQSLGYTKRIYLDLTNAASTNAATWVQEPTATHFTVGSENTSGSTYVAYLFAHDDTRFGDNQNESIIKCGSYTGTGSYTNPPVINLGFEPQFVIIKNASSTGDWLIGDIMRGATSQIIGSAGEAKILKANLSNAETSYSGGYIPISPTATGFTMSIDGSEGNASGNTYIYIAIRRPMKTPTAGTEVFKPNDVDNGASKPDSLSGFPVDMYFRRYVNTTNDTYLLTRLTSPNALKTNGTDAEAAFSTASAGFDYNDGVMNIFSSNNSDFHTWMFKRAPGFMDVVAYTGTGSATTQSHNLGVVPELIMVKTRSNVGGWQVYSSPLGATKYLVLNENYAEATSSNQWNDTAPTASVFTVGTIDTNESGRTYIAYLFATVAGVSKVGSYTGTGSPITVDCGFTSGARFILIKRTDSTGNWYYFDTLRGIVAGADSYLSLNTQDAEASTDAIDPDSSGFIVNAAGGGFNTSGGEYIFLAIA